MSDSESEVGGGGDGGPRGHHPFPFFFPFPMMMMGGPGSDSDNDNSDSDDEDNASYASSNGRVPGPHRVVLERRIVMGDYRLHLRLLECRYFDKSGFCVTVELRQKLNEKASLTTVEAVDRIIHSYVPESEVLGLCVAPVMLRPYDDFFDIADLYGIEDEVRTFCNSYGVANRCLNPKLQESSEAVQRGAVIDFQVVEIHPDHCGKDLSLRMMHEVLEFVDFAASIRQDDPILDQYPRFVPDEKFRWSLAITRPQLLNIEHCDFWSIKVIRQLGYKGTAAQKDQWAQERVHKLVCHFARFGFCQAGRNVDQRKDWFLTREMRDASFTNARSSATTANVATKTATKKRKRSGEQLSSPGPSLKRMKFWLDKKATQSLEYYGEPEVDKRHRGIRLEFVKALEEFFVSKHEAETSLLEGIRQFDRLIDEAKAKQESPLYECNTLVNVQSFIQKALEKSREEVRKAVQKELQGLRERFLEKEIPALLKRGKKGNGAQILNETLAIHRVLRYALQYPDISDPSESSSKNEKTLEEEVYQMDDFVQMLKIFVRFGADVNLAETQYGNRPLHVAQSISNKHGYEDMLYFLLSAGANPSIQNNKFELPANLLVKEYFAALPMYKYLTSPLRKEKLVRRLIEYSNALMSTSEKNLLLDGWLSTRSVQMLQSTAEDIYRKANSFLSSFPGNRRVPRDAEIINGGFFHYIPSSVRSQNYNEGFAKKFVQGWFLVFQAAHQCLLKQMVPSVENVRLIIGAAHLPKVNGITSMFKTVAAQRSALKHFIDCGGKIEFGIDALVAATEKRYNDEGRKSGQWMHTVDKYERILYEETPLDCVNEFTRTMLVNCGGGNFCPYGKGPFRSYL